MLLARPEGCSAPLHTLWCACPEERDTLRDEVLSRTVLNAGRHDYEACARICTGKDVESAEFV